jgi:uncharacterized membrane protein YozB (DUF420 family)
MLEILPTINALLNVTSAVLLLRGRRFIKAGEKEKHKKMMVAAFFVSLLFLCCYVLHKILLYQATGAYNSLFQGEGVWRGIYFFILITHVFLAALMPVLTIITLRFGFKEKFVSHKAIARWTFPLWLYVSVTGVIIYLMLYHIFVR